jgi:hypothetical protein
MESGFFIGADKDFLSFSVSNYHTTMWHVNDSDMNF